MKSEYCSKQSKKPRNRTQKQVLTTIGARSGLEDKVAEYLTDKKINFRYEEITYSFTEPSKERKYTPDFFMYDDQGRLRYIIETKGRFVTDDQHKMIWVKEAYPNLDFRLLFENPNQKIYKGSKTTCAKWADKKGFKWSRWHKLKKIENSLPEEWIRELKS